MNKVRVGFVEKWWCGRSWGRARGLRAFLLPRLWLTAALQGPGVPWADRAHTGQSPSWKEGGIGTRAPLALHCLAMPELALQPQTFSHVCVCVCVYMYVCVCIYISWWLRP